MTKSVQEINQEVTIKGPILHHDKPSPDLAMKDYFIYSYSLAIF